MSTDIQAQQVTEIMGFMTTVLAIGLVVSMVSTLTGRTLGTQLVSGRTEPWFIKSKPPTGPYLYHHAHYLGLKKIAQRWAIDAPGDKQTISLTTDVGRYLSPLPIVVVVTVDGVVKVPLTEEVREIAIPALYRTYMQESVDKAEELGYDVYTRETLPSEYRYILRFVVHHQMFLSENEYVVITRHLSLPMDSIIYVHPSKIKRFKAGLGKYSFPNIQSLEDLIGE